MDPVRNPFAPGAGSRPPELAGRDPIIDEATIAFKRIKAGKHDRGQLFLGLRGVGKTVLLAEVARLARREGYLTAEIEAPEDRGLPAVLVPYLRTILYQLSTTEKARRLANSALEVLRRFASIFRVKWEGVDVAITQPTGSADSGDLEMDLPALLVKVAEAAREADTPVLIAIDELQYLSGTDLAALVVSVHRITQLELPLVVFGAGLPLLAELAGEARSYCERLFLFPPVGALDEKEAYRAIREPVLKEGAGIAEAALAEIFAQTAGYAYFLQEWGKHSWNTAPGPMITPADVQHAREGATRGLDVNFFAVRSSRLTDREKTYLRALAELGPGPHLSRDVAATLKVATEDVNSVRQQLVQKGMIYGPKWKLTAFTVPMFDDYMRRLMPDWKPSWQ